MIRETRALTAEIDAALDRLDASRLAREYWAQDELLLIPEFLPAAAVDALLDDLRRRELGLNRNYVPRHKKGGSVSHFAIAEDGPALLAFYRSERFRRFLSQLVRADLKLCPDEDPHACALYFYTEAGDRRAQRLFSDLKDAFGYFGIRALLRDRGRARSPRAPA